MIKSHHNVGGLPERMKLALIEPLRELFKDEVRRVGEALGMPHDVLWRQPFPGPGLAVRCLGEITPARLDVLRKADLIVDEEIRAAGLYDSLVASFRRAFAGAQRGRHGRRPHLRRDLRRPRGAVDRRHDRRLGAPAPRSAGHAEQPHHQRGQGHQPRRLRHQLEAARPPSNGNDARSPARSGEPPRRCCCSPRRLDHGCAQDAGRAAVTLEPATWQSPRRAMLR